MIREVFRDYKSEKKWAFVPLEFSLIAVRPWNLPGPGDLMRQNFHKTIFVTKLLPTTSNFNVNMVKREKKRPHLFSFFCSKNFADFFFYTTFYSNRWFASFSKIFSHTIQRRKKLFFETSTNNGSTSNYSSLPPPRFLSQCCISVFVSVSMSLCCPAGTVRNGWAKKDNKQTLQRLIIAYFDPAY